MTNGDFLKENRVIFNKFLDYLSANTEEERDLKYKELSPTEILICYDLCASLGELYSSQNSTLRVIKDTSI